MNVTILFSISKPADRSDCLVLSKDEEWPCVFPAGTIYCPVDFLHDAVIEFVRWDGHRIVVELEVFDPCSNEDFASLVSRLEFKGWVS